MKNDIENKRTSERFTIEGPVKYSFTTSKDIFDGEIVNCSAEGICFESRFALQPGMVIFISDVEDNKYFRAEVKWCRKLDGADSNYFVIGAKYGDPALKNDEPSE